MPSYIVASNELGGIRKLWFLSMKGLALLMYDRTEIVDVRFQMYNRWFNLLLVFLGWLLFGQMYFGKNVRLRGFLVDAFDSFSHFFLENKFRFLNYSIVLLTSLLCCNIYQLCFSNSCPFAWSMDVSIPIITTASTFSTLVKIIFFLFAKCFITFCNPLDRLGSALFILFFDFPMFMLFCTKSINVFAVWWVALGFHFSLLFIWKGWFTGLC